MQAISMIAVRAVASVCLVVGMGCQNNAETGAAVGGTGGAVAGGAAAGAGVGSVATPVGTAVGAAVGAIGGAIIGAAKDRNDEQRTQALKMSADSPALASAVITGGNADINDDGFVTTDEILALQKAGLSDEEIVARCRATQQVFRLSSETEKSLIDAGLRPSVVMKLRGLNADLAEPGSPRG